MVAKKRRKLSSVNTGTADPELLERAARLDGWRNFITGLGVMERDARLSSEFNIADQQLSVEESTDLYLGDDIAARMVEALPEEIFREPWHVQLEDKDQSEEVMAWIDERLWDDKLQEGECWGRANGGAGLLLGVDDGQDVAKPLNLDRIKSFDWMTLLYMSELRAESYYRDIRAAKYGEVETYRIQTSESDSKPVRAAGAGDQRTVVHESRIIRFDGIKTTRRMMRENGGWGQSILVRPNAVLRDYQMGWSSAGLLLKDFSIAVQSIEGLSEAIGADGEDLILKRAQILDMAQSIARTKLIDSKEKFERQTTNLTGLAEILREFATRLASAAKMPVTKLMGISPAGLNATGESDIRGWYDSVRSYQRKHIKKKLDRLLLCAFRAKNGPTKGKEPDLWEVQFAPLWTPSVAEEAELRNKQAQTDVAYVNAGVVLADEVAISRFGGDGYSTDTALDWDLRAEADAMRAQGDVPDPGAGGDANNPPPGEKLPPGDKKKPPQEPRQDSDDQEEEDAGDLVLGGVGELPGDDDVDLTDSDWLKKK